MTDPSIRHATTRDAEAIAKFLTALDHPCDAETICRRWNVWENENNAALIVAGADGAVLGLITLHQMTVLHRPNPVGRITALYVDAASRGEGLGRMLVTAAESLLIDRGCGLIELTSHSRFSDAYAFYESLGFERTSVRFAKILTEHDSVEPPD